MRRYFSLSFLFLPAPIHLTKSSQFVLALLLLVGRNHPLIFIRLERLKGKTSIKRGIRLTGNGLVKITLPEQPAPNSCHTKTANLAPAGFFIAKIQEPLCQQAL